MPNYASDHTKNHGRTHLPDSARKGHHDHEEKYRQADRRAHNAHTNPDEKSRAKVVRRHHRRDRRKKPDRAPQLRRLRGENPPPAQGAQPSHKTANRNPNENNRHLQAGPDHGKTCRTPRQTADDATPTNLTTSSFAQKTQRTQKKVSI